MSVDTAIGAASQICGFVAPPIFRQFGYIMFCEKNAAELKEQVAKLKNAKARLQHRIDESTSSGEVIEDDVLTWLNNADELIKSSTLIWETNQVRWYLGFVPAPRDGYRLGRSAKKSIPKFELTFSELNFEKVSYRPSLRIGSATSSKRNIVSLKSQGLVLESVMEALKDDNVRAIGVYGMGGVGKTTLLKKVENQAKELNKFDGVTSVFVSQTPDMARISAEIKSGVGLPGETRKTVLLLLDDLWNGVTWNDFEVPEDNDNMKVRLVMTSRNQNLLVDEMRCQKTFSVGLLVEEEGWKFFSELVGSPVEVLRKSSTASVLLKKCAGLAVSVEALATLWKKKAKYSSSNDLSVDELIHDQKESLDGSVSIEWSYNYLNDSEEKQAKLLFRTIGLLGTPNIPIMTLLKYGVGLGLFGNNPNGNIMERARREVTKSLRTLQDSSLLLESDDSNHVKIHDVVRDVAVRTASRHDHALIFIASDGLKGWSRDKLKKCTAMSLRYSNVSELRERWNCPNLNTLIMEAAAKEGDSVELPNSFFKGMMNLKVIDLRNVRFTSVSSFLQSNLHHLTTLCLDYCYLENVAGIGKLDSLEVLSFVGSDIAELPEEIGGLTKLRLLDLSKCLKLKLIQPGVLERLKRLEELYLRESFDGWEIEGGLQQQNNSSLAELNNLHQMRTLEVRVSDASKLPPNLPLGDLVQYKVLIGDAWDWHGEYKESRTLKFKVMKSYNLMTQEWLQSALQKTQDLHLDSLCGNKESFHEVCREGFKELKHLHLQNSSSIKCIIWSTKWLFCSAFTMLESMNLKKLENLEKICHGLIDSTSFSQLKVVKVEMCDKLRNLFSLSMVTSLTKLEEIEVSDCEMVGQIFFAEKTDDDDTNEDHTKVMACCRPRFEVSKKEIDTAEAIGEDSEILSNLRGLTLRNLPGLTAFFTKEAPSCDSTNTTPPVFFSDSQSRKPLKLFSPSKFKEASSSGHLALGLGNLRRVEVVDCKSIVNLIDSRMLLKLVNLESLTISRCESLVNIFDLGGIDAKCGNVEILPKLYQLKLSELPKLVHIWKKNFKQSIEGCRKLRTLEIDQCEELLYLSSSSMCRGMESLTEINIVRCNKMETLFLEEDGPAKGASAVVQLSSLKILGVSDCRNLKTFLSGDCHGTSNSVSIDHSTAFKCNSMACWFCRKQLVQADTSTTFFSQKVSLPRLESLVLSWVNKVEKLWCNELPTDKSYYNLEFVSVNVCHALSVVFPATLIERLQNLKQLVIKYGNKLRTVIDLDVSWKTKKKPKALMLSQLQEVRLGNLENLNHIMKRDSETVVGFPNLKQLEVVWCSKLTYLLSSATATTLLKLETLNISVCTDLREVIYEEESTDSYKRNVIAFPCLNYLGMSSLDSLIYFSSESYLFDFTCLKSLLISSCGNLKTLVKPTSYGHSGLEDEDQANTAVQALFSEKVDLPSLERLCVKSVEVEEIWCREPPGDSFCKLKFLEVDGCSRLRNIFPSSIIKRLQNLESMYIHECKSLDDVFETPSDQLIQPPHDSTVFGGHTVEESSVKENRHESQRIITLTKLVFLKLGGDITLSNLWSGGYTLDLPLLKVLVLFRTAVGASEAIIEKVKLINLERLVVVGTEMMELWHNEPHVGSFCKLKDLQVEECRQLSKIIPSFMLKRLQNLMKLAVRKCNHLETVAELGAGLIDAQESEDKLKWFPFQNMITIQVLDCECLINLFTISERHYDECRESEDKLQWFPFQNMTTIQVENCECLISLFTISERHYDECKETTASCDAVVLPHLTYLRLKKLPNFIHLLQVHGQYTLELPSLRQFFLMECGAKEATIQKVIFPKELEIRENDTIAFFGSTANVLTEIMKALRQTDQNSQIIGAVGDMGYDLFRQLENFVYDEGGLFDCVLESEGSADKVQEELARGLGIIYGKAGVQGRAQRLRTSLLSNRDKRLLLVLNSLNKEVDLEAFGVPRDGLDPKLFKQILVSRERKVLVKMGAQLIVNIGYSVADRWSIFTHELEESKVVASSKQQQQDLQVLDNTNNDEDISFFGGSNTDVMNGIIKYLQNSSNNQMIGLLGLEGTSGPEGKGYYTDLFGELARIVKEEANMFDDVMDLDGKSINSDEDSDTETVVGVALERAQRLRQSLLNNKEKRILLVIQDNGLEKEMFLQVVGILRDGLDSKLFNIIVFSDNRELLEKIDAQLVIIDISSVSTDLSYYKLLDGYVEASDVKKLADECGCDDLARLLSKKLKGQTLRKWANALQTLKDSPFEYEARKRVIARLTLEEDSRT